jgi:hypothetical protein
VRLEPPPYEWIRAQPSVKARPVFSVWQDTEIRTRSRDAISHDSQGGAFWPIEVTIIMWAERRDRIRRSKDD